jgi:thiol-disulfide isomerase/thioredoxin
MTTYLPGSITLSERLSLANPTVVLCFCAAWCDTCKEYQPKFETLSAAYPDAIFVWIDIEDHPLLLGDEDVENFPTIAIMQGNFVRFMGTMLPHIEHLDRLIQAMHTPGLPQKNKLPEDLLEMLRTT